MLRRATDRCQDDLVSLTEAAQVNNVSLLARLLRKAIDLSGWKHAAIASALDVSPSYLAQMLTDEKAIGAKHLEALPDDVEAVFARLYAEAHGLIVVEKLDEDTARRHLAVGLFSLLAKRDLPDRAGVTAKAELRSASKAKAI